MSIKQYNPVKVKDPSSDGYSVKLHPRQAFQLILTQVFEDEVFDVSLMSDFLVLEEFALDRERSREIYCFSQKYDLEKFSNISTMFLGNVVITIKPDIKKNKEAETIRLCIYLNCTNCEKQSVITVINPDNHLVKIEPNNILHTVIFDKHHARWSIVGVENLGMECARSETVYNDVDNVYDPGALFCPEPRNVHMTVNPALDNAHNVVALSELNCERQVPSKEYHFWTNLSLLALKKANETSNDVYPMGEMAFQCKNDEGHLIENKSFELMLLLRGSNKRIKVAEFQAIRNNAKNWNLRYVSSHRHCVMTPDFNESIDLQPSADSLYIEIPHPSVYLQKDIDGYWSSEINLDAKFGLKVKELTPRYVNGNMIQRFLVVNILASKPPDTLLFIGAIRFVCREYSDRAIYYFHKSISLSLWKATANSSLEKRGAINRTVYRKPSTYESHNHHHKQVATFEVELVQMECLELVEGMNVVQLCDISRKLDLSGNYDIDDLMRNNNYNRKKKVSNLPIVCNQRQKNVLFGVKSNQEEDPHNNWYNWFDLI